MCWQTFHLWYAHIFGILPLSLHDVIHFTVQLFWTLILVQSNHDTPLIMQLKNCVSCLLSFFFFPPSIYMYNGLHQDITMGFSFFCAVIHIQWTMLLLLKQNCLLTYVRMLQFLLFLFDLNWTSPLQMYTTLYFEYIKKFCYVLFWRIESHLIWLKTV